MQSAGRATDDRILIGFRAVDPKLDARAYLTLAEAVIAQAEGAGGELISWGVDAYVIEFPAGRLHDVMRFAATVLKQTELTQRGAVTAGYAVGVTGGELTRLHGASGISLAFGPVLLRCVELARCAEPGETLLDPVLGELPPTILHAAAARQVTLGEAAYQALSVDLAQLDWVAAAHPAAGLKDGSLVGMAMLKELKGQAGALQVVRAPAGAGVSRCFDELETLFGDRRVLRLNSFPTGEPLGTLRRAVARAFKQDKGAFAASDPLRASLDALIRGGGVAVETGVELVNSWLTGETASAGVVLIDDVRTVDLDTLQVLEGVAKANRGGCSVVVRLRPDEVLPLQLADFRKSGEVVIPPLNANEVAKLLEGWFSVSLAENIAAHLWARTQGRPLALKEAVLEGLELGDLSCENGRLSGTLRDEPMDIESIVIRRFRRLPHPERGVVEALAIFGGEARASDLSRFFSASGEEFVDMDRIFSELRQGHWLAALQGDLLALASDSQRQAVLAALSAEQRRKDHAKAARFLAQAGKPLTAAAAAAHAVLASDDTLARQLAKDASVAAHAAGLEQTSHAFERFSQSPAVETSSNGSRPSNDAEPGVSSAPLQALPPEVVAALRSGDAPLVEQYVAKLDQQGRQGLAHRVRALAQLVRGETSEALRQLREARLTAQGQGGRGQCQAALAHGVALAAAGRTPEALMEALFGLARAREHSDREGEHACLHFIAQLTHKSGQGPSAVVWQAAVDTLPSA